jgi:hypothetical protein
MSNLDERTVAGVPAADLSCGMLLESEKLSGSSLTTAELERVAGLVLGQRGK